MLLCADCHSQIYRRTMERDGDEHLACPIHGTQSMMYRDIDNFDDLKEV